MCLSTNPNSAFGKYFVLSHWKRKTWLKWTQMDKENLFQNWKPSSRSNRRAIRSISIIIHVDWWLGKQLKTISKISNEKKWPIHVAQINFPYQNFSNLPAERKRPISTLLFINLSKFGGKEKQCMTCTKTVRKPNSSNFHNLSTED